MSSVSKEQQQLILDLLLGKISEERFYAAYPIEPKNLKTETARILSVSAAAHDATGVEFGLYLGHRFGFEAHVVDVLNSLLGATWHERHEDVVDALAVLRNESSLDVLHHEALTHRDYRSYDDARSLEVKAVRAIASLPSSETHERLEDIARRGDAIVAAEAASLLRDQAGSRPESR